ncbi:hypothetical protein LCGC14_0668090 [marine sediment metagenome]|uniref:Uncharacterized protein n=1 Tax=marine sediment metagenome TaxID=412755 RepID=A0A0F9TZY7_9ZZZZ
MIGESTAEWKGSNGQNYIKIVAKNHYKFGLLRGQKSKKQIKTTNRLINSFIKIHNFSFERFLYYAKKYTIPDDYKAEMQGLVEGTERI